MKWSGVMPAMTTPFNSDLTVDHAFLKQHAAWLLANGCTGLVMLGSLGEGATLEDSEKLSILRAAVESSSTFTTPVVAAVSSLSTANAVRFARQAEDEGCEGLMVLPPYVYSSDWREMKQHMSSVISATRLPCMLYNNPIAYRTDFSPAQIRELASEHENLQAVKESSADIRRIAAIQEILDDRLTILVGVDDAIVEGIAAGARGWIAGLVNAFPAESVALYNLAVAGRTQEAIALYRWFLPLLRMDAMPKFVQLIKWVQAQTGTGSSDVRGPRLQLHGAELLLAQATLQTALQHRPFISSTPFNAFQKV